MEIKSAVPLDTAKPLMPGDEVTDDTGQHYLAVRIDTGRTDSRSFYCHLAPIHPDGTADLGGAIEPEQVSRPLIVIEQVPHEERDALRAAARAAESGGRAEATARDDLVRAAITRGIPVVVAARWAGLTRKEGYQIRYRLR